MQKKIWSVVPLLVVLACLNAMAQIPGVTPPDHIVVVIEENHSFADIIGSSSAPFINSLAQQGASFTQSFAIEHPSEPNYLDLFSGTNQGVTDDSCPHTFSVENLASELVAAGHTFTGFAEDLPSAGSTTCTSGAYARKHVPWTNFTNIATSANQPFSAFPTNFTTLPTISFVIPNLNDDMHDGTVAAGDTWLQQHLNNYIQFAKTNNSLLIITWDEDDNSMNNQIPTIFVGPMVKTGQFTETINHFNVLRTLEDLYGLTHVAGSVNATPITDVWQAVTPEFTLAASPSSASVAQGSSVSSSISTTVGGGFNSAVSLSVSGLPSGVTASFNPASIAAPGSGSSTLTFAASGTATTGTATVTVTASGGGITHTTTIALTVNAAAVADFSLSASPTSVSVAQGGSGTSTITVNKLNGFSGSVSLAASGLPAGVTASFNPASATGTSTLTFSASSTATTGTATVTITGTSGALSHTTTVKLTVTQAAAPSFTLSASPATLTVVQGNSGTSTITVNPANGFNGSVSLAASGLPTGVTASFNPASTTGTSTLTLSASSTATTGAATVTITGTSGSLTQTTTISLTISAAGAQQLLGNPGFENGTKTAPWTLTPQVINNSSQEPPHSGQWDAWLDGFGSTHTDSATQTVTIPANITTATLSFFLHIDTAETTTTAANDVLQVQVLNSSGTVLATLGSFSNLNHATGYQQHSFSMINFKGQTVQIRFTGTENNSLQTSFVLDDTSLTVQ
ncbi:MAG TPA: alkaline phosphatase family protein [Candidatus Angelobacter sp.]|nr:alkaline phosphatase family protein [Candidatus Angelobacter sp.]